MRLSFAIAAFVVASLCSLPAVAAPGACQSVSGKLTENVITPFGSPNDPLGRSLSTVSGRIGSFVGTSILTSVGPGPLPGTLGATSRVVLLEDEEDQLTALGVLVFTPVPGTTNATTNLTLTVNGGTGKYASATGTITATGIGFNFFPLPPGPSSANRTTYDYQLGGQICGVEK